MNVKAKALNQMQRSVTPLIVLAEINDNHWKAAYPKIIKVNAIRRISARKSSLDVEAPTASKEVAKMKATAGKTQPVTAEQKKPPTTSQNLFFPNEYTSCNDARGVGSLSSFSLSSSPLVYLGGSSNSGMILLLKTISVLNLNYILEGLQLVYVKSNDCQIGQDKIKFNIPEMS
jgi:hypothetical protein